MGPSRTDAASDRHESKKIDIGRGLGPVRQRRTEQRLTSWSSSNAQAGSSSGPWRPWDDRPATSQNVHSTSGPSNSHNSNTVSSLQIPSDHNTAPPHSSEPPTKSRILELLNSMQSASASLSKGNDKGGVQAEEDSTALSTFTCPVCFSPPENATLTPCGHVMCTFYFSDFNIMRTEIVETQVGNVCSAPSKQRGSDMRDSTVAKAWLLMEPGMRLYVQCAEPPYRGGTEEEEG
jgi:hypothetical protein